MDLRDRLNAALGGSYTIERELGGGGMARVFVAREIALNRAVVVKVLPPELAAEVSEDRFRREVLLAASLQHPHIVPILSAGQADRLLYYTMPLIEGETLRSKLSRERELPVTDAVRVLACVADAMAYAHGHGIVHRDIKPENILLTGQHALVTDFGVAKALGEAAGTTLTGTGLALGTAAYMAPEQVAADPAIDHRADIYAFGILAYETLTGSPPFTARTSQQLAAAHLTQQPERIAMRRPAIPAALATLIMSCLEKRPADRPQSADQVTRELSAIAISGGQPASGQPTPGSRRTLVLGAAAALLLAAVAATFAFYRARNTGVSVSEKRVVVAVLSNETGDPTLAPLGKMAADWITQGLQETGFIDVVDLRTVLQASQQLAGGNVAVVDALALQTGAAIAVWGSYYIELDSLIIRAQIVNATDGKLLRAVSVGRVSRTTPTLALELLREQVLAALAPLVDPRLAKWETSLKPPSYAAYRAYMEGLETYVAQTTTMLVYDSAAARFAEAVRLDSTFQTARLWQAFNLFLAGRTTDSRYLRTTDSVIAVLQQYRGELSNSDSRFFAWFLALRRGDIRGTYVTAKAMMNSSPGSAHAIWETALAAVRTNRPAEAIQLFDRPELAKRSEGALLFQGYWSWKAAAFHLLGDYAAELEVARDGKEAGVPARGLSLVEARAHAGLGNSSAALSAAEAFVQGTASLGGGLLALRQIVEELTAHGQVDAARTLADRAIEAYRVNQIAGDAPVTERTNAASILYAVGRFDEAHALLSDVTALDSASFPSVGAEINAQGLLAVLSVRSGDASAARRRSAQLEARTLDPVFKPLATYWRARIAAVLGERQSAMALLRRADSEGFVEAISARFLHSDPDLRSLQSMPEFREFVKPKG